MSNSNYPAGLKSNKKLLEGPKNPKGALFKKIVVKNDSTVAKIEILIQI